MEDDDIAFIDLDAKLVAGAAGAAAVGLALRWEPLAPGEYVLAGPDGQISAVFLAEGVHCVVIYFISNFCLTT